MHVKGYAAPETKAAGERARLLIEQAEAIGEAPDDPWLLFSVLYGIWTANFITFNGDAIRELGVQFLALAEKQGEPSLLVVGHRIMALSLASTGNLVQARAHYDCALSYPVDHRSLRVFGHDVHTPRSFVLWILGYPEAALTDAI